MHLCEPCASLTWLPPRAAAGLSCTCTHCPLSHWTPSSGLTLESRQPWLKSSMIFPKQLKAAGKDRASSNKIPLRLAQRATQMLNACRYNADRLHESCWLCWCCLSWAGGQQACILSITLSAYKCSNRPPQGRHQEGWISEVPGSCVMSCQWICWQ